MSRSYGLLLVFLGACVRHAPTPTLASQLAERKTGRTLSAYLGQRDASSAVCDLNARGPHLIAIDADVRDDLIEGLRDGRIAAALWRQCVDRLLKSADRERAAFLLDAVAHSFGQMVADRRVESDQVLAQQLSALRALLLHPSSDVGPHASIMATLVADLRAAIAKKRLGHIGQRYANELIAYVELTHGTRDGRPIDVPLLDELLQARDDSTLRRYARRLPDASLRSEAQRRVIRLEIKQSQHPQVRANTAAVEDIVMRVGSNPVTTAEHRLLRGWIDTGVRADHSVLVRQDLAHHTITLLGSLDGDSGVSVLPQLSLRGTLHLELEGIDGPVTVCAPAEELDPDPCLPAAQVRLISPWAYLEPDGTIRVVEHLTVREAVALAATGQRLVVPIIVGGQQLTALDWGFRFETPNDLVFGGGALGAAGPDLRVRVEPLPGARLSYTVSEGGREYVAIVEGDRANDFHVVSQGGDGERGSDGSSGRDGLTGQLGNSAICPSSPGSDGGRGEDGGPGEDGAAGGAGGNGGNILVEVAAGPPSDELLALIRRTVVSRGGSGGAGGFGGSGGRGGAGGSGGQGTTCTDSEGRVTTLSGGSPGGAGTDGRSGFTGMQGANGRAGHLTVR